MTPYIGTKRINAKPMNRQEYSDFRGWNLPADEDGTDEGYLVEYVDGGAANTDQFDGYVSWSPKAVFEKAYNSSGEMTFGDAVELMKSGLAVARKGWNGKGQYVFKIQGSNDIAKLHGYGFGEYENEPVFTDTAFIHTSDNKLTSWVPSQSDQWAEDWGIVE